VTYQIRGKGGPMYVRAAMCRFISAIINFYQQSIKIKINHYIQSPRNIWKYVTTLSSREHFSIFPDKTTEGPLRQQQQQQHCILLFYLV
jgi:hypothetical protein